MVVLVQYDHFVLYCLFYCSFVQFSEYLGGNKIQTQDSEEKTVQNPRPLSEARVGPSRNFLG